MDLFRCIKTCRNGSAYRGEVDGKVFGDFHLRAVFLRLATCVLTVLVVSRGGYLHAAIQKYWDLSPYAVQLHIAIDESSQPRDDIGAALVKAIGTRIRTTVYPLWKAEISLETGNGRLSVENAVSRIDDPDEDLFDLGDLASGCDKRVYLSVVMTRLGIELRCREFDSATQRWGAVHKRQCRQESLLIDHCFQLICESFSPLAIVRSLPENESEVLLQFRGSELPRQSDLAFLFNVGEAYQPIVVRTNSSGEIKEDSIRDIPWTYLTLAEKQADGWHGRVHTGTRRPFGVRRRARVEHLALAMRAPVGTGHVRFYARHNAALGLTGYEVFRRAPDGDTSVPMGLTDSRGSIAVPPGKQAVTLLFLRSEGQLLAKVPVVPRANSQIEVPIADDTARLRAQAALTSLTEQLIDTVAKRNILIARVRDRLKNGNVDEAQELFTELDSLPGRSQFDREIQTASQRKLHQSSDPKVQERIDKLFADTRKLLSRFLSTKPISEVQGELTAARRGKQS